MSENCAKPAPHDSLKDFVTSLEGDVFALKNLPEVVKGALFSKYSRSKLGLRPLLEREFLHLQKTENGDQESVRRARDFYDRILDGYGDDSIGELGGAHLAIENVSMIGAKVIEDCRIGGSPLEKSTRYIPFDIKVDDRYPYWRDPLIAKSALAVDYTKSCDQLFSTYSSLFALLLKHLQAAIPPPEMGGQRAHLASLRARAFDAVRGLLPASTLTNVGLFGNGRFFEGLLQKLRLHPLGEMRQLGQRGFDQLARVIPSFIRRAEEGHPHLGARGEFEEHQRQALRAHAQRLAPNKTGGKSMGQSNVDLIDCDAKAPIKVAAALLYPHADRPLRMLEQQMAECSEEELKGLFSSICHKRTNRRHKGPRALERAEFTFDLMADFGSYRDLQRHRTLTQERQLLTCDCGYSVPNDLESAGLAKPYQEAMERAQSTYRAIQSVDATLAQYCVPMGYQMRWYFHINLRALQWLCELRSGQAGHSDYRRIAQQLCHRVVERFPVFAPFFGFVDFSVDGSGRLAQEERLEAKSAKCSAGLKGTLQQI